LWVPLSSALGLGVVLLVQAAVVWLTHADEELWWWCVKVPPELVWLVAILVVEGAYVAGYVGARTLLRWRVVRGRREVITRVQKSTR